MNYRKWLISIVTFLGGIYFFLEFVIPPSLIEFDKYHITISDYFIAVGVMAIGLGLINLLLVHGSKIIFVKKDWPYSLGLLIGLFLMIFVTFGDWLGLNDASSRADAYINLRLFSEHIVKDVKADNSEVPKVEVRLKALKSTLSSALNEDLMLKGEGEDFNSWQSSLQNLSTQIGSGRLDKFSEEDLTALSSELLSLSQGRRLYYTEKHQGSLLNKMYLFLFEGVFVPLGSAMFSLLGFYIAAAAYRAFRIKSFESALMMGAALLVMLGQIPFGLYIWDGFPALRLWILKVPNAAAFRAIDFGAQVALLIMAFRMWLSIESESFTERDSE